ncbi:MAG: OsmC family peroxiredoxin [Candidatus Dormibacteraeota bacterium]|nr:OsmC family peroxiredoxin [Candidatus Dormibacteraeota bacterium]
MAVESSASATWNGELMSGQGTVRPASGAFPELALTWRQRAESRESGTSPEELIAAAHAGCFAMALSFGLGNAGHPPERLETGARVGFQPGQGITGITLSVRGRVPGIDQAAFKEAAEAAKADCPVSKALAGVPISLEATLES